MLERNFIYNWNGYLYKHIVDVKYVDCIGLLV